METVSGMKSVYLSGRVMFRKKVKQQRQQHWSVFTLADAELHHHGTLTAACHIYAPRERGVCVWLCWYKCGYLQRVAQNHMSSMGGVEQGRWDVFVVSTLFSFATWVTAVEHTVWVGAQCVGNSSGWRWFASSCLWGYSTDDFYYLHWKKAFSCIKITLATCSFTTLISTPFHQLAVSILSILSGRRAGLLFLNIRKLHERHWPFSNLSNSVLTEWSLTVSITDE